MQYTDDQLNSMAAGVRQAREADAALIALRNVVPPNPPQARRDAALSQASGVPLRSFDETTRAIAETRERQNFIAAAFERAPDLVAPLLDPRRYERAADDIGPLADVSEAARRHREAARRVLAAPPSTAARIAGEGRRALSYLGPVGSIANWISRLGVSAVMDTRARGGVVPTAQAVGRDIRPANIATAVFGIGVPRMAEGVAGLSEMLAPLGNPAMAPFAQAQARSWGDYFRSVAAGNRVETETRFGRDVLAAAESAPSTAAAYAGGIATGSARLGAAALGAITAGGSYREGRQAGMTPLRATVYGVIDGTIETVTELVPMQRFIGDLEAGSGLARTVLHNIISEGVGEQAATLGQDFNRWAQIDAPRGKPFTEFLNEVPDHALSTVVASTLMASTISSAGYAADRGFRVTERRLAANDQDSAAARNVDRIMEAAAGSRTRQESPEDFRAILAAQLDGLPGENLYISAEAVRTLHQSPEDLANDSFWGAYADQIDEAEALGGDVVVPLAAAATHLAGNPQWEALKDHVRVSPGGDSRAEIARYEEDFADAAQKTGEEFAALLEADRAAMEPVQKVYEGMRDKLMHAGFRPDVASNLATQFAQRQRVRAERMGKALTGAEADTVDVRSVSEDGAVPLRTLADEGNDQAIVLQALVNRGRVGVQEFADVLKGVAGLSEADRLGSVPTLAPMLTLMRGIARKKSKVLDSIVRLVPVDMVNNLFGSEAAAKVALHEQAMLKNSPAFNGDLAIAGAGETAGAVRLLVIEAARQATELASVASGTRGGALEAGATTGARELSHRKAPKGKRAAISFEPDLSTITISFFEERDLSSFIHESGHLYLEELKADAELALQMDTDQARQLFADWETVKAWFKREGHEVGPDGHIPTEAHELFARGFERFAMEGKAPSSALRRAFEAFRSWLLTIYKVTDNLKAPITPEIREVMARLLATDEEIQAATEEQNIKALFNTAEEAGMTEAEFGAYRTATEEARGEAFDALLYRTMASIRAQKTKEYRDQEANVRAEVMAEVDNQPIFRALRLLRNGAIDDEAPRKIKLDRQFLIDSYGADALDAMPRSVPPIYAAEGTHPDLIAEETGFASGDEMIRTLMGHEQVRQELKGAGDKRTPRQVQIDEGTAAKMAERYGDPLRDGSIEEEARALIHNDKQGEIIASEIRALARRANKRPTPYSIARQWAADKIAAGKVVDVASGAALQNYQRSARKAAKAAEEAMLKGGIDETYRQKQMQMLNNALISEGKKAKDQVDAAVTRLGKLARRKTMASVDQDYLEQVHGLLEEVEFRARSQASLDRQASFEEWAREREAEGHDLVVPASFAGSLGKTHWSRLSVEELIGLDETVKQILHLGRMKQTILDGQERRKFQEVKAELIGSAGGGGKQRNRTDANDPMRIFGERVKSKIRWVDAALIRVEMLADWLDGGNSNGPWNRYLFKPLADAQGRQGDLMRVYVEKVNALIKAIPKKQARDWDRWVDTPELINNVSADPEQRGTPFRFGKDQIVMIALNMGNEGNRQRLLDGYGWSEAQVQGVLDRLMTAEDWQFVQGVWDTVNELWPDLAALERRVNGVEPDKIEATPIETPFGTFKGGYFPAVYDTTYSTTADLHKQQQAIGGGAFFKSTTRASASKERAVKVKRPMLLNMSVITRHLGEVIHDITHREAVIQVAKILADGEVRASIDRALGPEYIKAMEAWLEDIASPNISESRTFPLISAVGRHLHKGVSMVGLGYRVSTVLVQPLGLANMAGIVGERAVLEGMATFSAHPIRTYKEVTERSAEMRDRFSTMDASIAEMYRDRAKNGLQRIGPNVFEKHAFDGILYADLLITTGGWIGAFNKGLREGMTEEEATYYADKVIRTSQGAGGAKDKSAILRANMLIRTFYPFFSYLNALYGQQRDIGRRTRNIGSVKDFAEVARRSWWILIVPPLAEALLRGSGPDDDDEESWAAYLARAAAVGNFASIPFVGQIVSAWGKGWGYRANALQSTGEGVVRGGRDIHAAFDEDEEVSGSWLKNLLTTTGALFGLPLGQVGATAQFGYDVATGEQEPQTAGDVRRGVMTGKMEVRQ